MKTTSKAPAIQDINLAVVAQGKRRDGARLNRKERRAIDAFRDLYRDTAEIKGSPALCNALSGVLDQSDTNVASNPLLSQHLTSLRSKGAATDAEIGQIGKLASRLSEDEDDAISATLAQLSLQDGVSSSGLQSINGYLDTERAARSSFVTSRKVTRGIVIGVATLGAAVAAPLLFWVTPLGGALAAMGSGAAAATQLGTVAGGFLAGGTVGSLIGGRFGKAAKNYGVDD